MGFWLQHCDPFWTWWKHPVHNVLYRRAADQSWSKRRLHTQQGNQLIFGGPAPVPSDQVPPGLLHASVMIATGSPFVSLHSTAITHEAPIPEPATLQDALHLLPSSSKWAIQRVKITDNGQTIATAIQQGTAVAVSDGSLKLNLGTSAFVICGPNDTHSIVGVNVVPGCVRDGDSLRCELSGIYAICLLISVIVQHFGLTGGAMHVACDNQESLRVFDPEFYPHPQRANFDLVNAIWKTLQDSPLQWTCEHVYGHQDTKQKRYKPLSHLAHLNVSMDHTTKWFWTQTVHSQPDFPVPESAPHIKHEGWQVWDRQEKVTDPSLSNLYDLLQDRPTQMWWVWHGHLPKEHLDKVDWYGTEYFMVSLPPAKRRWVTKTASHNCGVGTTLVQWNYQDDAAWLLIRQPGLVQSRIPASAIQSHIVHAGQQSGYIPFEPCYLGKQPTCRLIAAFLLLARLDKLSLFNQLML
jgi:hypothetical protein